MPWGLGYMKPLYKEALQSPRGYVDHSLFHGFLWKIHKNAVGGFFSQKALWKHKVFVNTLGFFTRIILKPYVKTVLEGSF